MPDSLIQPLPLAEFARKLRESDDLPAMLERHFRAHIAHAEPQIQAFVPETHDFSRLLDAARVLQAQFPAAEARPPLYGVPVGIKDVFHVEGMVTRAGTSLPPELFAGEEAAVVRKLKAAGALIMAKTVTTEFAYFEPGPTRNPYNLRHTPGGSSSGSAAAVGAGLVPLATGTQTVGSVIRPAAYCGCVGYKPSYDRIDTAGLVYFSRSADHVGLFTQDVAGMALAASALVNDWRSNVDTAQQPRLAIPEGAYLQSADAAGLAAFRQQAEKLREAGYEIIEIETLDDIEAIGELHNAMIAAELAQEHAAWFADQRENYRPRTLEKIEIGQGIAQDVLEKGRAERFKLRDQLDALLSENGADLWICPPAPATAPQGIDATGSPRMNLPWTNAGLPALTLPAGFDENSLPFGLQLVGRFAADEQLLAWAQPFEALLA